MFKKKAFGRVLIFFIVYPSLALVSREASAARYINAEISIDGEVVLEGPASDNGHADADQVWDYLKTVRLRPAENFSKLQIRDDAKEAILSGDAPKGELGTIVVEIMYGGKVQTRQLKIVRVPRDKQGREWQLDPAQIEELFDRRWVRRSDVARLKNPERSK